MKTESTVTPPESMFLIERTENNKCNIHMYENVMENTSEGSETIYSYDLYVIKNIPFHDNLENNITECFDEWLTMAKILQ